MKMVLQCIDSSVNFLIDIEMVISTGNDSENAGYLIRALLPDYLPSASGFHVLTQGSQKLYHCSAGQYCWFPESCRGRVPST